MTATFRRILGAATLAAATTVASLSMSPATHADVTSDDDPLVGAFMKTSSDTKWDLLETVDFNFDVHHPQGMDVRGNRMYVTTVAQDTGHLLVLDRQGNLLRDIDVTDGIGLRYHPGGLDIHGKYLYTAVAEYRRDSTATVIRVNLKTYEVEHLFSVDDHLGGVVYDRETKTIVGQSWGSRRIYTWKMDGTQVDFWMNPTTYTDYQDCEYVETRKMLCSGQSGWFDLVDLTVADRAQSVIHATHVPMLTDGGKTITGNPTDIDAEVTEAGTELTLYGAPDDDLGGEMYVYRTLVPSN